MVDDKATVLLGDQSFPRGAFRSGPPDDALVGDNPVVVTSPAAATGGPGPNDPESPIALRQRILSEAVVRLLSTTREDPTPDPLVVVLPSSVTATGAGDFWAGLDQPWLRPVGLSDLIVAPDDGAAPERQVEPDALNYPPAAEEAELSSSVLSAAGELIRSARLFQSILGERYAVGEDLVGEALAGTSYAARGDASAARRHGGSPACEL